MTAFFVKGNNMTNRKVEILAPAGSYESLKAAVSAGADAVYIGGSRFGARAYAENLDEEQMLQAIDYMHIHGRKIYLTVNTLLKDEEIEELYDYLLPYYKRGIDAVIVQDVGVLCFVRENFPGLPIHISTQMTVTNALGASFFKEQGAERIVPARELNLLEVKEMKEKTGLEIECFVHGALCYCYSGQCLMSSMLGGRSGNRGQCAQPCRLPYSTKRSRPQTLMSLKDLCTIDMIPELVEAGIDSFKIEGRMKQPEYVYTAVSMYRKYTDLYLKNKAEGFRVSDKDRNQLWSIYRRRGYSDGYYKQQNGKQMISLNRPEETAEEIKSIADYKIQEKINGKLILSEGSSAKLYLEFGNISAECEGAVVQKALNQPLDRDRIKKQMQKTGTTQFTFDHLEIETKGNIFLPMQALNELRREGIQKLEERICRSYYRTVPDRRKETCADERKIQPADRTLDKGRFLCILASDEGQLRAALSDRRISLILVDSSLAFKKSVAKQMGLKNKNQKIYLAMPYIFRDRAIREFEGFYKELEACYDGIMIRNWESYMWLKSRGYKKEIITDYNMYIFNRQSKEFFRSANMQRYTAPVELNSRELKSLDISDGMLIAYGYQPVMITAGCVRKNTGKCDHEEGTLYIKDRYQKKFAVKNYCKYCYNVIYNSLPLMLLHQAEEIKRLNPAVIRLDFTTESESEAKKIIDLYVEVFQEEREIRIPDVEYTKGHFKRGVK